MLEQAFQDVYTKFKLHFYQNIFQRFATREATLTTVESFCMEGIMAMGEPTIAEFSRMMQISTPNAAYKIGSLVKKGYVEKIQSTTDRREYHLRPTQKYIDYYNISYSYLHTVVERARERFSPEDCAKLEEMLTIVSTELMPELDMLKKDEKAEYATKNSRTSVREFFCFPLLLLFIYYLDLALLPQHIGGKDADGQHHDDEDAHKATQHGAVACKACGEGEHRHDDEHRQHALDAALDHLAAAGRAGEQAQRHGAEQRQQQRALDDVLHGCHKMSSH